MKLLLKHLSLFFLLTGAFITANAQGNYLKIQNYQVYYGWAKHFPQDWMILRRFENEGKTFFLMVNPQTLATKIDETNFYEVKSMTITEARTFFKTTPYQKALLKAESQSMMTQDAGIESGVPKEMGISLTADLCPSHRPLDRRIFTDIITEFKKVEHPVPVALSITGIWMRQHQQDLQTDSNIIYIRGGAGSSSPKKMSSIITRLFKYQFDDAGNWIQQDELYNNIITRRTKRKFEYYQ